MLSNSNSKNSSSDDDLAGLDVHTRRHFLDYTIEHPAGNSVNLKSSGANGAKIEVDLPTKVTNITNSSINNNGIANNYAQQSTNSKKKSAERGPSTSKMETSTEQLNKNTKSVILPNNVDAVYSILSMLGSINSADITSKFLEFSKNREMCSAMRLSGCISLLVQIIHSEPHDPVRQKECVQSLHNIISCHNDDKVGRREARVLKLNEQLFAYCDVLRSILKNELSDNNDRYPIQAIGVLMKISFDEDHRYAMCQLGALQTISTLIQLDHQVHGPVTTDINCITLRRYAGMCLTNLTFGDGNNKALLCSNKNFMRALVTQINSSSDELVQVTASVIRNLSWRADANMKEVLNEIGTVKILTNAAMKCSQENTLKAILSALWNLSNHCAKNKAVFCEIKGAIEFLVDMLSYEAVSKTSSVIENAGGILRNISTHIAMHEDLRAILRFKNCLIILLQQLKSPSLTVVSNACGTLGNLSAHSTDDQKFLRENGAVPMLRSLIYSKHKMISTGSTIALRHLLACKSNVAHNENLDSVAKMMDLKELPTLNVRKQKALEHELSLSHENSKPGDESPDKDDKSSDTIMKVQDIEDEDEDAPTNFSKLDDDQEEGERVEYQETNLDQITDYSIRYAENQSDSEEEVAKPVIINSDDTMKSYNTEGTPHAVLSGATSMSDLRKEKSKESSKSKDDTKLKEKFSASVSGLASPEKTVNYCVEGTPGNFSRNGSLSDLEENCQLERNKCDKTESSSRRKVPKDPQTVRKDFSVEKDSVAAIPKSVTFMSLAEETPLMFSRTSSMGSLSSAEPVGVDDKSSVMSDFSRIASGIVSPSELPDSPTQSVPQSPSRSSLREKLIAVSHTIPPLPVARKTVEDESINDSTNVFNVENTPAVFSYAASCLSNLSFDDEPKISTDAISKDFDLMKHPSCEKEEEEKKEARTQTNQPSDTADASDVESVDDDILLESCINIGMNRVVKSVRKLSKKEIPPVEHTNTYEMPKFSPQVVKDNLIDMSSVDPLLPPYLPVVDELSRFIVEDSPCNFSLMSNLSALTIESSTHQEANIKKQTSKSVKTSKVSDFNDSLSSLSIESEDDGNLLSQTISAGSNKQSKNQEGSYSNPINIPLKPRLSTDLCNDSISSVDSCSKDDVANSILEQCIQSGINKVVKKDSSTKSRERSLVIPSPRKSMLPTYSKPGSSKSFKNESKALEMKDEILLQECINTGIRKNTRQEKPLAENLAKLSIKETKNSETTSVIPLDIHPQCLATITGVEVKTEESSSKKSLPNINLFKNTKIGTPDQDANIVLKSERSRQENWVTPNGCSTSTSFEHSLEDNILERSNEYPAAKLSLGIYNDLDDDSMNISNEFMVENEKLAPKVENKHKDPDLMMKSVDRLTHELVSTAEYLRQNAPHTLSDDISKMSGSNTWNDENSFPSISLSAPMIGSTNEEITVATDQFCPIPEEKNFDKGRNDLEDKTPTNENYTFDTAKGIHGFDEPSIAFKVGGEIGANSLKKLNFLSNGPTSIETCSTMSNSTIVQVEAKRIAYKLTSMTNKLMDSTSSLDLENVRPPSSMDCVSISSFQESSIQQSPFKKKSLVTGLIAKRALGHQMLSTSLENVNSIQNIDSIRPPSIMDELLDSMISVDSIVSEIVEATTNGVSNYETALSDMEDSLTLRSCQDLSKDDGTFNATSSDFSSVETTPKKKKSRTLKLKRQSEKDRYRTYTIQVDMLLKEQQQHMNDNAEQTRKSLNARQRRQDDRQRFETQIISHSLTNEKVNPENIKTNNIELDDSSIQAMTDKFEFIRKIPLVDYNIDREKIKDKLDRIRLARSLPAKQIKCDESLEYERQNSETESQRDMNNSLSFDTTAAEHLTPIVATSAVVIPKPVRSGKNSYVSPYRMTRVTPLKNKSLKVTKSPIIAKVAARNSSHDGKTITKEARQKLTDTKEINNFTVSLSKSPSLPIRQGTFIQEEPTLCNVPVVNDLPPSPAKTVTISKLKTPAKISSKIPTTPSSTSQLKYRSNSNASMKIPIMTPVRSNTGISLKTPKKTVSSKIAGIWKNENKKESFLKKPVMPGVSSNASKAANKFSAFPNSSLKKL